MMRTIFRRKISRWAAPRLQPLESRVTPAMFTVTNNFNAGAGSLRQAVIDANAMAGADTIDFKAGLPSPITLTTGTIAINQALTITGPGATLLSISGNNVSRIFNTSGSAAGTDIFISGLTMTDGNAATQGGAVFIGDEGVTFNNCIITGNTSVGHGGGIYSDLGALTLVDCTVSNNSTTGVGSGGGGIGFFSSGKLGVFSCTVSGNTAAIGGGIVAYNFDNLMIFNCAITGNTAKTGDGGGVFAFSFGGADALIQDTTISGNIANAVGALGGGIGWFSAGGLLMRNSTVAFNSAAGAGGGINNSAGSLTAFSSIIAKNSCAGSPDISGDVSSTFGFIGNTTGANVSGAHTTGDPLLAPLANNGGPTQTHALLAGSPCINKGTSGGQPHDQRGSGFVRAFFQPDIGAYEDQHLLRVINLNDSGDGSLRQVILNANANPGDDTVLFYTAPGTITLTTGEIAITDALTISTLATTQFTVSGNNASRIFNITSAPAGTEITINSLIFTDGKASSFGGAIRGDNQLLTLANCKFTGNSTTASGGGAVAITAGGSLTSTDCFFSGNTAAAFGGAIDVFGAGAKTILQRCHISGNVGTDAGGIYARNYLLMENCTLSGNQATAGSGGAVFMSGNAGPGNMIARNCTFAGNTSTDNGGGIALVNFPGELLLQNSTITNNSATAPLTNGGGISLVSGTGLITIESSVVSGNTSNTGPDIFSGGTVNVKTSAIGSGAGFAKTDMGGNLPFQPHGNLGLTVLAFNGGPIPTLLPVIGSPLIDAGSNPAGLTNDQRGAGFVRISDARIDIGATEVQHSFIVLNDDDAGVGSLRQALVNANANPGADTITFDPTVDWSATTIKLTTNEIVISDAVAITGQAFAKATVSGNNAGRIFNITSAPIGTAIAIANLTLIDGKASSFGGAIRGDNQQLNLANCVFTKNSTTASGGGAVAITAGGSLTATDCDFSDNTAAAFGGALDVFGAGAKTVLQRCNISGNSGTVAGAVFAQNYLLVENSTLSGNQATAGQGGAVYLNGYLSAGTIIARNSTISGNTSTANGGGIVLVSFNGTLTVQNSTITNNSATALLTNGGGISRVSGTGNIAIESSIVSGNMSNSGPDIFSGGNVTVKTSAIGENGGFTRTNLGGNLPFQPHANLKLGALAANGGPMQTHRPQAGSPLLDVGSNPIPLLTDQRGVTRVFGPVIDIGSVEVVTSLIVTNDNDAGQGSLRQNIIDANLDGGANTITFDPVFFATPRTITLVTGNLLISDAVNIQGLGPSIITVSGDNHSRCFLIQGPGSFSVSISGLTVTKGNAGGDHGGGFYSVGQALTVQNCVVSSNSAGLSTGIDVHAPGSLTLIDSSVIDNSATLVNAGIFVDGLATIIRCTVAGNKSGGYAGGLRVNDLIMEDSTVSGNSAEGTGGGGIYVNSSLGVPSIIRNSTISGNTSSDSGGGIHWVAASNTLTIQNSTIVNNMAGDTGGGIFRSASDGMLVLESTIVSGNAASAGGPDLYTPGSVDAKASLIGIISGITTLNADAFTTANVGMAPLLGPLAFNGGPTKTHALLAGSPAINNGANLAMLANDQRGAGFLRSVGIGPDIGAFELQPGAKVTSVIVNNGDEQRSRVTSIAVAFDQHLVFNGGPVDAFQLKRQDDGKFPTLSAMVDNTGMATIVTLTFSGVTAVDFGSLADGRYSLTIFANQIGAAGLDGNGDNAGGDNYVLVGDPMNAPRLFRLFGDADGNGSVSAADFNAFRLVYGTAGPSIFDFDGDGLVSASDFNQFRTRYGVMLVP